MKFKDYNGENIRNGTISVKIDGVHAIRQLDGTVVSRHGKPLYNIPSDIYFDHAEIYLGSFKNTIQVVRSSKSVKDKVLPHQIYHIYPTLDHRLYLYEGYVSSDLVAEYMNRLKNIEGLVIYDYEKGIHYKVKHKYTWDATIIGRVEGSGKNKGRLGAFRVMLDGQEFKVGTGFTDKERVEFWKEDLLSLVTRIVEVEGMELLPSGKIRHPRFVRLRLDK